MRPIYQRADVDEDQLARHVLVGYEANEPEIDDSVKFCPDCETPNQFGELCNRCIRDRDLEDGRAGYL